MTRASHIAITLFILLSATSAAQDRSLSAKRSELQRERWLRTKLTHAAFSPDGNRIAIAWYIRATNRPGTNWMTGVALWDLKTGKASELTQATGPVAFSPDGRTVLAARYERQKRSRISANVLGPALWNVADSEAVKEFPLSDNFHALQATTSLQGVPMLAAACHPNGKHIAVVTARRSARLEYRKPKPSNLPGRTLLPR